MSPMPPLPHVDFSLATLDFIDQDLPSAGSHLEFLMLVYGSIVPLAIGTT